jgi:THO complex subunit 3
VRFWDSRSGLNEGVLQLTPGTGVVINMAWSFDGATLAAGTDRDELLLIDARKAAVDARKTAVHCTKKMEFELNQFAWSGSGLLLLAAGSKTDVDTYSGGNCIVRPRLEAPSGIDRIAELPAHAAQAQCVRFDPSFRFFATGGLDAAVSIWDAEDLAIVRVFDRFDTSVNVVSFSSDSAFLAVGTELERTMDVVGMRQSTVPLFYDSITFVLIFDPRVCGDCRFAFQTGR